MGDCRCECLVNLHEGKIAGYLNLPFLLKYFITDFNEVPINTMIPVSHKFLYQKSVRHKPLQIPKTCKKIQDEGSPSSADILTARLCAACVCVCVSCSHSKHMHKVQQHSPIDCSAAPPSGSPVLRHTHTRTHTQQEGCRTGPSVPLWLWLPRSSGCLPSLLISLFSRIIFLSTHASQISSSNVQSFCCKRQFVIHSVSL